MKYVGFCILFFCSCTTTQKKEIISIQKIGPLIFEVPKGFMIDSVNGIDSYSAYLISNDTRDTFHIEYGPPNIINNLYEPSPAVWSVDDKEQVLKRHGKIPGPDEVSFSKYRQEDEEQKIFDKNYFLYDTINTIIVKIVQPKKIGNGITGMYIPQLKDGNGFSIYAINLDSSKHRSALSMFKTFRYKYNF